MNSILALDVSGSTGSVALMQDRELVFEECFDAPRGRGEKLFAVLERALQTGNALSAIVCGIGPGSYNGIRMSLAAAYGVSRARGIPLLPVCSLRGLGEGEFLAIGDARANQVYFAHLCDGRLVAEPELLKESDLLERVRASGDLPIVAPGKLELLPQARIQFPLASHLARLAETLTPVPGIPEPMYLKPAHVTLPKVK